MNWSPQASLVHGTLQAKIMEWLAFPYLENLPNPEIITQVSYTAGRFFTV